MDDMTNFAAMTEYGVMIVKAIVVLLIGLWAIGWATNAASSAMTRSGLDETLAKFLKNLTNIGLKVLLVITVAAMVGVETTSFIAILGAAGLAVGLALQGALSNFAGGVLILVFRPYKVGDVVTAAGETGSVKGIEIFNTVLATPDNKTIIIPNGAVCNGAITNFSTSETRRVDIDFGIGYDDDLRKAKDLLTDLIAADDRVLSDPAPQIVVSSLGDSAVNITTRSWVSSADYWGVYFDLMENVKLKFDDEGISIPFPQTDVHIHKSDS